MIHMPLFGEAKRKYQREWMAARRAEGIKYLGGKCVKCSSKSNLNVDHIDSKKKVDHRIWSWAEDKRKKELDKCQLLCETCHQIKTTTNGEHPKGEQNKAAIITVKEVLEIRKRYAAGGITQKQLAKEYGIKRETVTSIVNRRSWKHV